MTKSHSRNSRSNYLCRYLSLPIVTEKYECCNDVKVINNQYIILKLISWLTEVAGYKRAMKALYLRVLEPIASG